MLTRHTHTGAAVQYRGVSNVLEPRLSCPWKATNNRDCVPKSRMRYNRTLCYANKKKTTEL